MGSLVIIMPTGFLAVLAYFIFSANAAGWLILLCLAVWNLFALFKSFSLYKSFAKGISLKEGEVLAMASQPFVSSITLIAIIFLLFVDFSKIHLLWFYPLVSFIFDFTIGKRAVQKLEPFGRNPLNHSQYKIQFKKNIEEKIKEIEKELKASGLIID